MNLMQFLSKSLEDQETGFLETAGFPLSSEQVADEAINAMLMLMNLSARGRTDRHYPEISDHVALIRAGISFPWQGRITFGNQVDLRNDQLPDVTAFALRTREKDRGRGAYCRAISAQTAEKSKIVVPRFHLLRNCVQTYRMGYVQGFNRLSRAAAKESSDLENVWTMGWGGVLRDGTCVGCGMDGLPHFYWASALSYVIGLHNDRRYFWNVSANESIDAEIAARAHFAVDQEYVKSLFYARSLPLTATGRMRPILHWVEAHKRRLEKGIEVDVRKHMRGITEFGMYGVNFQITEPRKAAAKENAQ